MTATGLTGLYLGSPDAGFYRAKEAFINISKVVERLEIARTLDEARGFLDTQTISILVLNLGLDRDRTARIIEEIRQGRPYLKIFAVMPFQDVVAHNCWCIASGIDGTITVDQFRDAIRLIEAPRQKRRTLLVVGACSVLALVSATFFSASPITRFLGVFWLVTLAAEFTHCTLSHRLKLA
jgi:hypothetical protein